MDKYKGFKRQFVSLLGELQAVIAQAEGNQRLFLRMIAATLEGAYKALLIFDGDVTPAAELMLQDKPALPPQPAPPKPGKPKAAEKQKYGHFSLVRMTEADYRKLVEDYGEKATADYIGKLELYIGSKGDKYKNHYMTIMNWLTRDGVRKTGTSPAQIEHDEFMEKVMAHYMQEGEA